VKIAHNPANLAKRLAKIYLCMARRVAQRYEHLPRSPPPLADIIGDNGDAAGEAVFIAKTLINPLRSVPLLLDPGFVLFKDLVDDPHKRIKLGTNRRGFPAIPWWHRVLQNL
jgi:hypothetical protein